MTIMPRHRAFVRTPWHDTRDSLTCLATSSSGNGSHRLPAHECTRQWEEGGEPHSSYTTSPTHWMCLISRYQPRLPARRAVWSQREERCDGVRPEKRAPWTRRKCRLPCRIRVLAITQKEPKHLHVCCSQWFIFRFPRQPRKWELLSHLSDIKRTKCLIVDPALRRFEPALQRKLVWAGSFIVASCLCLNISADLGAMLFNSIWRS